MPAAEPVQFQARQHVSWQPVDGLSSSCLRIMQLPSSRQPQEYQTTQFTHCATRGEHQTVRYSKPVSALSTNNQPTINQQSTTAGSIPPLVTASNTKSGVCAPVADTRTSSPSTPTSEGRVSHWQYIEHYPMTHHNSHLLHCDSQRAMQVFSTVLDVASPLGC